ncbi:MAG: hypothetical protein CHACPFDD_04185 [Phycisphaerae bacterium]|nr:hypothetical protein [Phycisphaerae bacterium]
MKRLSEHSRVVHRPGFARTRVAAALLALSVAGCQWPQQHKPVSYSVGADNATAKPVPAIDAAKIAARDDIVELIQFWQPVPWLFDASTPVGFKVRVYAVSAASGKGAFGTGAFEATMHVIERDEKGQLTRKLVHRWTFNQQDATGFRITKLAAGGYSYGFMLNWPKEAKVCGKHVEINFSYQRGDGRVVKGSPLRRRVPAPAFGRELPEAS